MSITISREAEERAQIATDKLFGVTHSLNVERSKQGLVRVSQGAALPSDVPAFSSLQEMYTFYTGDSTVRQPGKRVVQIFGVNSFPAALANACNKRLVRDYAPDFFWRTPVTEITSVTDFRPANRIRLQSIGDLPIVEEDGTFDEIDHAGDEKTTFSVITRGAELTLTRRAIINNDVDAITRLVDQMGRSAFRTLAKRVWGILSDNPNYGADATALFHNDHANLGSAALSPASLSAARTAIFNQTEPASDERLCLRGPFALAIPQALEDVARTFNSCDLIPGTTTFEGNPCKGMFGAQGERIYTIPFWDDPSDWVLFDVSGNVNLLEIGFLMGRQNPELFTADAETVGQAMTQDRVVLKMRHEYEVAISDFRGFYKGVVS